MGFSNPLFASAGDSSGFPQGMAQPTQKVEDLSPHVDGGQRSTRGTMSGNASTMPVYDAAIVVGLSVVLLWIMGAFSFRNHNL